MIRGNLQVSTYTQREVVKIIFRRGVQFSGSFGSAEGAGTRTISRFAPLAWRAWIVPSISTRWIVPGTKSLAACVISGEPAMEVILNWNKNLLWEEECLKKDLSYSTNWKRQGRGLQELMMILYTTHVIEYEKVLSLWKYQTVNRTSRGCKDKRI